MNSISIVNGLLTTEDLAAHLQVSVGSLKAWRYSQEGPRFIRVGRSIRYRLTDVEIWVEANARRERRRRPA